MQAFDAASRRVRLAAAHGDCPAARRALDDARRVGAPSDELAAALGPCGPARTTASAP